MTEDIVKDIETVLKEKGDDWMVAAMVYGSIGYHTPSGAMITIRDFKEGRRFDGSERCLALYGGDCVRMLSDDIKAFKGYEELHPDRAQELIKGLKVLAKAPHITQMSFSMMYPSVNV